MSKDTEWLKNEVQKLYEEELGKRNFVGTAPFLDILDRINQLDEPSITEEQFQKYITEHDLAVVDKPVIPHFLMYYIESEKSYDKDDNFIIYDTITDAYGGHSNLPEEVKNYINEKDERTTNFVKAVLFGYEVEEQKYVIEDKKVALLCKFGTRVIPVSEAMQDEIENECLYYELTEPEIKDYDERYWPFAVPVEEAENDR